jgi:hypothetical protein
MTRTLATITSLLFCLALSGCIVHEHGGRSRYAKRGKRCHSSQHWDGNQCRHNGRGHGARKHDGDHHGRQGKNDKHRGHGGHGRH